MTTLKEAAETLAKLARNEAVDRKTLEAVSAALASKLADLAAPGAGIEQLALGPATQPDKPKRFRIDRSRSESRPIQSAHVMALERAGHAEDAFEAAMANMLADKAVTVKILRDIAADYSDTPVTSRMTRSDAERLLRQAFARRQWQTEAYRRLDELNAGK